MQRDESRVRKLREEVHKLTNPVALESPFRQPWNPSTSPTTGFRDSLRENPLQVSLRNCRNPQYWSPPSEAPATPVGSPDFQRSQRYLAAITGKGSLKHDSKKLESSIFGGRSSFSSVDVGFCSSVFADLSADRLLLPRRIVSRLLDHPKHVSSHRVVLPGACVAI